MTDHWVTLLAAAFPVIFFPFQNSFPSFLVSSLVFFTPWLVLLSPNSVGISSFIPRRAEYFSWFLISSCQTSHKNRPDYFSVALLFSYVALHFISWNKPDDRLTRPDVLQIKSEITTSCLRTKIKLDSKILKPAFLVLLVLSFFFYWVLKWWRHKNDFWEIMSFIRLVRNNLSDKSSHAQKKWLFSALNSWDMGFWRFKLLHTKLSYLVLVPEVRTDRP